VGIFGLFYYGMCKGCRGEGKEGEEGEGACEEHAQWVEQSGSWPGREGFVDVEWE